MKDLGEAAYILGIKIYQDRSKRLIGLCQSAYIEKILKIYYMENSKRGTIPMQEKIKFIKSQGASTPAEIQRMQNIPYASVVESLMYDVRCDAHWTAIKNILKYLRNTKDMFLVYRGVVDWKSTKQSIFATSSTNDEYIVAFDTSKEAVWIRKFISGLGFVPTIEEPINMYCDNTGAIAIEKDHGLTKGARHFRAKVHYLRETIEMGDVKIEKVDTYDNLADPFTKALAFPKHSELTKKIRMIPASSLMKSKAGKRFGFVRFINVINMELLIGNLCTVWIGRMHLHANEVRFNHASKPNSTIPNTNANSNMARAPVTYASKLKGSSDMPHTSNVPALILMELDSELAKTRFLNHIGVASWFEELKNATNEFIKDSTSEYYSDDESVQGVEKQEECLKHDDQSIEKEDELDAISETDLENDVYSANREKQQSGNVQKPIILEDPFQIYKILKTMKQEQKIQLEQSVPFPPGYTPIKIKETQEKETDVAESNGMVHQNVGSILEVMDDMMRVGQTMGYSMEGCNSGGMLCVWESNVFHKEKVTISDNFMAIYGRWLSTNTRMLLINVYALQNNVEKRVLWDYILHLINLWDGESIIMEDFNEVRTDAERFGSVFDMVVAQAFNNFISCAGLRELTLDGYSFTWAHKSASKMNKLDILLLSEGILVAFPQILAICLDRHLSDHRSILLREVTSLSKNQ
ncbi:putative RNA-directed DNA polymerase, eukaryota, reverse transcriptase zinc-binding domain protein [Tanacetum coccineum]